MAVEDPQGSQDSPWIQVVAVDYFANDALQPELWFLLTTELEGSFSFKGWVRRMAKYYFVDGITPLPPNSIQIQASPPPPIQIQIQAQQKQKKTKTQRVCNCLELQPERRHVARQCHASTARRLALDASKTRPRRSQHPVCGVAKAGVAAPGAEYQIISICQRSCSTWD